jgi:hypothetical protein
MSGLVHRLANQAMGTGDAKVHAAMRSRYSEPLTGMAIDQPGPDRIRDRPHSDSGSASVPSNARAVSIVKNPGEKRAFRFPESDKASVSVMPATAPFHARANDQIISAETIEAPRREAPTPPLPARVLNVPTDEAPGPRMPRQLVEHPGRVRPEPATALRPNAAFDRPLPSMRDSEPNEVHVHIGRIEVTAVAQPAPPKRRAPAPVRGSMSLTDYLAQRQRRAP